MSFAAKLLLALFAVVALTPSGLRADDAAQSYKIFCQKCHGPQGHGDGPAAATLKTKPRDFSDCARMAKLTDETLFNVIKNGGAADGLSADMPAWKEGFEDSEIHGLVQFVHTFCKH